MSDDALTQLNTEPPQITVLSANLQRVVRLPAINPAKGIHRRIGMKPPFIILHSSFHLESPSILPKAFTGELA